MRVSSIVLICVFATASATFAQEAAPGGDQFEYSATHPDLSGSDPHWLKDADNSCWVFDGYPSPGETVKWSGACKDGLASGEGTETFYLNGKFAERRTGTFTSGSLNGHGVAAVADGTTYDGEWRYGARQGHGMLKLPNGGKYVGLWPGQGVYTGADGHSCEAAVVRQSGELRVKASCPL